MRSVDVKFRGVEYFLFLDYLDGYEKSTPSIS